MEPKHSISIDLDHSELHFSLSGFWNEELVQDFLQEAHTVAAPLVETGKPYSLLGDLREFVPQDRATAAAIENSNKEALNYGVKRLALVTTSPLVKLQYRRITEGLNAEFFEEPQAAKEWLRQD